MVNYDIHNGFSVSSVLAHSDEQHDLPSGSKHTHIPNTTTAHSNRNAVGSGSGGGSRSKKPTAQTQPSISILTISDVHFLHVGNYTCAPSNAKQASITVHVLRGNFVCVLHDIT